MNRRFLLFLLMAAATAAEDSVQRLYERARLLEERNRDLPEAVRLYAEVVSRAKTQRALAARAQLEQGVILKRLGKHEEAKRAFRAVLTDFPDQIDIAAEARRKLAGQVPHSGMSTRQVWKGEEVGLYLGPSPDGRFVAYVESSGGLALHDTLTGENRSVTRKPKDSPGEAMYPVFSPDGKEVAYLWYETIKNGAEVRIARLGTPAAPRVVWRMEPGQILLLLDWSPDGKYIGGYVIDGDSILLIPAAGGPPRSLKVRGMPSARIAFAPDSRYIAYDNRGPTGSADIYIHPLDGGAERVLVQHAAEDTVVGWDPSGRNFLFLSDRTGSSGLWMLPYKDGAAQGAPRLIKDALGKMFPQRVTRQGSLFYSLNTGLQDIYTVDLDISKPAVLSDPKPVAPRFVGANGDPSWSRDGKYLSYLADRGAGGNVIVLRDLDAGTDSEFRPALLEFTHPRWCADGPFLSMIGSAKDGAGIYRVQPFSRAATLSVKQGEFPVYTGMVPSWSPDGKLHFRKDNTKGIFCFNAATRRETLLYAAPAGRVIAPNDPVVSPDGKFVAFNTWKVPTQQTLLIVPVAGGPARELLTVEEPERFAYGGAFAWTPDSRHLLAARGAGFNFDLWRVAADGSDATKLELKAYWMRFLDLHPDGKRLAYQAGTDDWELWAIDNFLPANSAR